jgi:hypothetical protein
MARVFGRLMRQTSVFDRKGTRWLIQVLSPPPTVIILVNREAFRGAHQVYSRMIARRLARLNRLPGDPEEAVLRNLPMLGLRRVES